MPCINKYMQKPNFKYTYPIFHVFLVFDIDKEGMHICLSISDISLILLLFFIFSSSLS